MASHIDVPDVLRQSDAVVLIDGRSGAGKSTFADRLVASWPGAVRPVLVRMDDIYPGWSGLDDASSHVGECLIAPRATGQTARWRRHDWVHDRPAEWHVVPAGVPLVIEGCGTLSRTNASLADLRIWLEASPDLRKRRALTRDAGAFDAHWEMWTAQMESFVRREDPVSSANVVIDNDDGHAVEWIGIAGGGRTRQPD